MTLMESLITMTRDTITSLLPMADNGSYQRRKQKGTETESTEGK